jgi:hypothetical protein
MESCPPRLYGGTERIVSYHGGARCARVREHLSLPAGGSPGEWRDRPSELLVRRQHQFRGQTLGLNGSSIVSDSRKSLPGAGGDTAESGQWAVADAGTSGSARSEQRASVRQRATHARRSRPLESIGDRRAWGVSDRAVAVSAPLMKLMPADQGIRLERVTRRPGKRACTASLFP